MESKMSQLLEQQQLGAKITGSSSSVAVPEDATSLARQMHDLQIDLNESDLEIDLNELAPVDEDSENYEDYEPLNVGQINSLQEMTNLAEEELFSEVQSIKFLNSLYYP
ncbi:hypothetical protein V9T40_001409 [Parthenolecanium corni]|uniref:Uncharacterized protein n=1 Tax=Parthenolecanium corni TaxID=536013 RepID=A0AAN9Y2I8_9HEMI